MGPFLLAVDQHLPTFLTHAKTRLRRIRVTFIHNDETLLSSWGEATTSPEWRSFNVSICLRKWQLCFSDSAENLVLVFVDLSAPARKHDLWTNHIHSMERLSPTLWALSLAVIS